MKEKISEMKILVTGGPTPVRIDEVRWISNVFGGTTGYMIALQAASRGAKVKLLLGPHQIQEMDISADKPLIEILAKVARVMIAKGEIFVRGGELEIVHYRSFNDLMELMRVNISTGNYNAVIHSAAVADYAPVMQEGKIKSNLDELVINTKPTPKIIKLIKTWDPDIYQVQFKLEVGLSEDELIKTAFMSLVKYGSDLVVANNMAGTSTTTAAAYFIDHLLNVEKIRTRKDLYDKLIDRVAKAVKENK